MEKTNSSTPAASFSLLVREEASDYETLAACSVATSIILHAGFQALLCMKGNLHAAAVEAINASTDRKVDAKKLFCRLLKLDKEKVYPANTPTPETLAEHEQEGTVSPAAIPCNQRPPSITWAAEKETLKTCDTKSPFNVNHKEPCSTNASTSRPNPDQLFNRFSFVETLSMAVSSSSPEFAFIGLFRLMQNPRLLHLTCLASSAESAPRPSSVSRGDVDQPLVDPNLEIPSPAYIKKEFDAVFDKLEINMGL
ncbi:hypothetical protein BC830DRAFT_1169467 [Chytriomyces sp. MP71]|nr:hypothetical protein BC830DRAFT_1169467 [Chytriomyces sp. MP71]